MQFQTHLKPFWHQMLSNEFVLPIDRPFVSPQLIAAAQWTNLNAWTTAVSQRDGCVTAPTTVATTRMSPTAPAQVSFTLEPCPTWRALYTRPTIRNNLANRPPPLGDAVLAVGYARSKLAPLENMLLREEKSYMTPLYNFPPVQAHVSHVPSGLWAKWN